MVRRKQAALHGIELRPTVYAILITVIKYTLQIIYSKIWPAMLVNIHYHIQGGGILSLDACDSTLPQLFRVVVKLLIHIISQFIVGSPFVVGIFFRFGHLMISSISDKLLVCHFRCENSGLEFWFVSRFSIVILMSNIDLLWLWWSRQLGIACQTL